MSGPHFHAFSPKQREALTWWCQSSPHRGHDAIICDGAVRSGKTLCMSLSFVFWAFAAFDRQDFAICGKTITSLRRNVAAPLTRTLSGLGFSCVHKTAANYMDITWRGRANRFYLFGGRDESSAALIQGITLAGVMLDEVALMPRSFVEQALARCSVTGSKLWFNCNPEHPSHWFYIEWIQKARRKNALYLHFTMADNPSLSPEIVARYHSLYTGAFYQRFVLGEWAAQAGAVYPMFDPSVHVVPAASLPRAFERYYLSCDYGTVNPASFGLWGLSGSVWFRVEEYYYDSRREQAQRTDAEYCDALERLAAGRPVTAVVVDPSAASFIECLRRRGDFTVLKANNDVMSGIRQVGDALKERRILFSDACRDAIREFSLYCWDPNSPNDAVKKQNDHAMDDIRYFVTTALNAPPDCFFAANIPRTSA